ncbi:unnamed protein product [Symbiodinium sp. CCMP2592]|nr:unnamed protein product [Symbiodinium sp. CCMP2592]
MATLCAAARHNRDCHLDGDTRRVKSFTDDWADHYRFLHAAAADCVECTRYWLQNRADPLRGTINNPEYNALAFAKHRRAMRRTEALLLGEEPEPEESQQTWASDDAAARSFSFSNPPPPPLCPAATQDPYVHVRTMKKKRKKLESFKENLQTMEDDMQQHYMFLYAACDDCVPCVSSWLHKGVDPTKGSYNNPEWTAEAWAVWSQEQRNCHFLVREFRCLSVLRTAVAKQDSSGPEPSQALIALANAPAAGIWQDLDPSNPNDAEEEDEDGGSCEDWYVGESDSSKADDADEEGHGTSCEGRFRLLEERFVPAWMFAVAQEEGEQRPSAEAQAPGSERDSSQAQDEAVGRESEAVVWGLVANGAGAALCAIASRSLPGSVHRRVRCVSVSDTRFSQKGLPLLRVFVQENFAGQDADVQAGDAQGLQGRH